MAYFVVYIPDDKADDFEASDEDGQPLTWDRFDESSQTLDWYAARIATPFGDRLTGANEMPPC